MDWKDRAARRLHAAPHSPRMALAAAAHSRRCWRRAGAVRRARSDCEPDRMRRHGSHHGVTPRSLHRSKQAGLAAWRPAPTRRRLQAEPLAADRRRLAVKKLAAKKLAAQKLAAD